MPVREAINQGIDEEMEKDERVFVLGKWYEDAVSPSTETFSAGGRQSNTSS
jgi:pyruvate/2-oxoglutarate/acetoin dehydrogenase E1 component